MQGMIFYNNTFTRLPSTPSQQPIRIVRTPRNSATAVANYRTPKTPGVGGFDQPPGKIYQKIKSNIYLFIRLFLISLFL